MSATETLDISPPATLPAENTFWTWLDAKLERWGDRINPILVKESRQALKSRQFTVTFALLLLCGWGWSLISVGLMAERFSYGGAAVPTFIGYFIILAFPVLVIVPFAAFLSLVAERDEGTYELLSITSLTSGQIVRGKLGSAVLQMMVYFSALAPCIVFTYLLRGIDIVTIAFILYYTFFGSLLLSAFGLLLATLTRAAHARVLLSGLMIIGLSAAAWGWVAFAIEVFIDEGMPTDELGFWIANLAFLCFAISFLVLFTTTAAAQISFASDNRSTRVRRIMFVQQVLFIGWVAYAIAETKSATDLVVPITFAGIYWAIAGALMTGELAELSPRVRRTLPRTALGRVFLTWFNPGSGTGYVFTVANMATVVFTIGIFAELLLPDFDHKALWYYSLALLLYIMFYLGAGRLVIQLARRHARFGTLVGFLIQAVVAGFGGVIPAVLQFSMYRIFGDDYTLLQIPNWGWTLTEFFEEDQYIYIDRFLILIILAGVAVPMFLVNVAVAAREVAVTRMAAPQRVLEDDQQAA